MERDIFCVSYNGKGGTIFWHCVPAYWGITERGVTPTSSGACHSHSWPHLTQLNHASWPGVFPAGMICFKRQCLSNKIINGTQCRVSVIDCPVLGEQSPKIQKKKKIYIRYACCLIYIYMLSNIYIYMWSNNIYIYTYIQYACCLIYIYVV